MSPNKRKSIELGDFGEDESFQHRRSSLKVNLSYLSESTDSGNGSFQHTLPENNTTIRPVHVERRLRSRVIVQEHDSTHRCSTKSKGRSVQEQTLNQSKDLQVRDVRVVIEDINSKEQALNASCKRLKDEILNKTREIFDRQNELSMKTVMVLNSSADKTESVNSSHIQCIMEDTQQNITVKNVVSTELQPDDGLKINSSNSPILTGSNKTFSSSKLSLRTPHKMSVSHEKRDCNASNLSISTLSEEEGMSENVPIVCSTFIENHTPAKKNKVCNKDEPIHMLGKTCGKDNVMSMEVTEVHGGILISSKELSAKDVNSKKPPESNRKLCRTKTDEKEIQNYNTKTQNTNQNISIDTEESIRTVRSSLNVNTSLDPIMDTDTGKKTMESNPNHHIQERCIQPLNSEYEQESINTVRTSLQVNTSLDALPKLHRHASNLMSEKSISECEKTKTTYTEREIHSLEDMSLLERLRNISVTDNKTKKQQQNIENERKSAKGKTNYEDRSYIENTPYPVTRSILLKSHLKYITAIHKTKKQHTNTMNQITSKTDEITCLKTSVHKTDKKQRKATDSTVILEDSSFFNSSSVKPKENVIIPDSSVEIEAEKSDRNVDLPKKTKRKLLALHESSQPVSLSPREIGTPEDIMLNEKSKTLDKKHSRKKPKSTEKDTGKENKREDYVNIFHKKKKEQKVPKKPPRKIFSKKIVVKKFADKEILSLLEANRVDQEKDQPTASGDSLDDFDVRKKAPVRWNTKSRKIIIVTTGLSKGDKSLVKSIVKSLGNAEIESRVTRKTTHVVSTGVRTINLLLGIIRGCWLVNLEWVLKSLENNRWLDPEEYEMKHFSKAVMENRKDRQLFGASYTPELFATCGFIYIESGTTPPAHVLKDLIKAAGGWITENPTAAKIVIGTEGLKENWVLDSITTGTLQSFNDYTRK